MDYHFPKVTGSHVIQTTMSGFTHGTNLDQAKHLKVQCDQTKVKQFFKLDNFKVDGLQIPHFPSQAKYAGSCE